MGALCGMVQTRRGKLSKQRALAVGCVDSMAVPLVKVGQCGVSKTQWNGEKAAMAAGKTPVSSTFWVAVEGRAGEGMGWAEGAREGGREGGSTTVVLVPHAAGRTAAGVAKPGTTASRKSMSWEAMRAWAEASGCASQKPLLSMPSPDSCTQGRQAMNG